MPLLIKQVHLFSAAALAITATMYACAGNTAGSSGKPAGDSTIVTAGVTKEVLPEPFYQWDTSRVFQSSEEVMAEKHRQDSVLEASIRRLPDSADKYFLRDSAVFALQDDCAISLYKTLEKEPKTPKSMSLTSMIVHMSMSMEKSRMEALFNQFPKHLRENESGKKIARYLAKMGYNNGKNINDLLTAARMTDRNGTELSVSWALRSAPVNIIVFGASWCGPCKYQSKILHHAAAGWDTSQFRIVHLSIDRKREKWLADEERLDYKREAYLLGGDFEGSLVTALNAQGVPRYVVVDPEGNVLADERGSVSLVKKLGPQLSRGAVAAK